MRLNLRRAMQPRSVFAALLLFHPLLIAAGAGAGALGFAHARDADIRAPVAFVDVTTLPMTGDSLLTHQTVLVRNGRIDRVGAVGRVPLGSDVIRIDGRGRYLMPGLADLHTHLRYKDDLLLYVAAGVTTVLNLSQPIDNPILAFKRAVAADSLLGPNIFASGIRIDGRPNGPFDPSRPFLVRTPEEAVAEVRRQHDAGFQIIKAYSWLPADAFAAIIAEAQRFHMPVVGHVPHSVGVLGVLKSGQRMIAHSEEYLIGADGAPLDSTGQPSTAVRRAYDVSRIPEMVNATRAAGVYVCATLSTTENIASQWGRPQARDSLLAQSAVPYVRPEWRNQWRNDARYIGQTTPFEPRLSFQRTLVKQLFDAGVPLLLGTDSPGNPVMPPGTSLYAELAAVVRAGVTPLGVLRAGTRNASNFLTSVLPDTPPFGAIEQGRIADLILLEANPLSDINSISRQVGVMVHGQWLTSARLREMVEAQANGYAK